MTQEALCTLRNMVLETPDVAGIFEELDVDYYCRGNRALRDALNENGVSLEDFKRKRDCACPDHITPAPDWHTVSLRKLVNHIVNRHHAFLHGELPALGAWMEETHPGESAWLPTLRQVLLRLKRDFEVHMRKEETILFPAIVEMEIAVTEGRGPQALPFGSVANFSRVLEKDHRRAANLLRELRVVTNNYRCPPAAPAHLQTLFRRLQTLVADVHQHIHLENNVLFPRAIDLEKGEPQ